jgi:hypothetical protein
MQYFLFNIGIPGLNNTGTEIFKITWYCELMFIRRIPVFVVLVGTTKLRI